MDSSTNASTQLPRVNNQLNIFCLEAPIQSTATAFSDQAGNASTVRPQHIYSITSHYLHKYLYFIK